MQLPPMTSVVFDEPAAKFTLLVPPLFSGTTNAVMVDDAKLLDVKDELFVGTRSNLSTPYPQPELLQTADVENAFVVLVGQPLVGVDAFALVFHVNVTDVKLRPVVVVSGKTTGVVPTSP